MKKQHFFLMVFIPLFWSCVKKEGVKLENKNPIEKADWFIGTWKNTTAEMDFTETWKRKNDSTFLGESYVLVLKDTVFYERINLIEKNDSLFYIVSVRNQNKEKPTSFYLTKSNNNQLVFENPKHDFPKKITYTLIQNDSLVAEISGNGKSELFPMKRQ